MMRYWMSALLLLSTIVQAEVTGREVNYSGGGLDMQGYLAWDDAVEGKRPGILVVHEWWGHNEYARERARQLAELGYTALAVDMYGEGRSTRHPEEAQGFMEEALAKAEGLQERFTAALAVLENDPRTEADNIAAIGYCFGGGVVLNMARAGVDLDGVVSFHGGLEPIQPAQPDEVKAEILVFNGAADPMVTEEQIAAFKNEMDAAGAEYEFVNYPGVKHSFTNPAADELAQTTDLPIAYDPEADRDSWQRMQAFFKRIFD